MTYVSYANTGSIDAFSRLRTSQAQSLFEAKFLQDSLPSLHNDLITGAGTITYVYNEASNNLTVGTASGDSVIRESHRYATYIPGNSSLFVATAILGPQKSGTVSRVGLYNDNNGLFFERNATDVRVVVRSNTSGSVSDANFIAQTNWNKDKLDGTGSSGFNIDWTKAQIFVIDFQWLGFGKVRFGFDFGGQIVYCHELTGANLLTVPYMRTPSLPVRYEIRNVSTSASSSTMKQICYAVKTEGPTLLNGVTFSVSNGITPIAVTTKVPILAIRLMNSYNGHPNRRQVRVEGISFYCKTNDCLFEYGHVHSDWTSVTGGTWTQVDPTSGVEYNTGITAITGGTQHTTNHFYVSAGQGSFATGLTQSVDITGNHSWINQNVDSTKSEIAVIWATSLSGTTNVAGSFFFNEIE